LTFNWGVGGRLSRYPYCRALITALVTALNTAPLLLLLLPLILPLLFYPLNPLNLMESFVTITGQTTRGGGSSRALSSRTPGKAPAVP
jgi:hypothetical protein